MSALSRIRNNIGLVAIIIFIALLGFILTDLFSSMGGGLANIPDAGRVGGEKVTLQEFSERYQNTLSQYGGAQFTEAQRNGIMDNVWNQLVAEKAFGQEFERIGLQISGDELHQMFVGDQMNPIVQQYFVGPGQEADPTQIQQRLESLLSDEAGKEQLKLLEDFLAQQRTQEIYNNMLKSGFIGSKAAARYNHLNQNRNVDIQYLGVNFNQVPDSVISLTDRDLKNYLSTHASEYQREEGAYVNFVTLPIDPSSSDTLAAFDRVKSMKKAFAAAENDSLFTAGRTRSGFNSSNYRNIFALPLAIRDSIRNSNVGDVVGPVLEVNYYKLYKLVGTQNGEEEFIKFRHIMLTPEGTSRSDSTAARRETERLARRVNDANFAEQVNELSRDFASKRADGEVGWYGESGRFGEDFFDAISSIPVGGIRGGIKSNSGYHVVEVLDKTSDTYLLANVESDIYSSSDTRDLAVDKINELAALAQNVTKDLDSAATQLGFEVVRSNLLTTTTNQLPGIQGGRDVVKWAMNEASEGDFSKIFEIENAFVYAQMLSKQSEGLANLDDVRIEITNKVRNEKKAEYILSKLGTVGDDFEAAKTAYGAGANTGNANAINFQTNSVPGIGIEPLIIGRITSLQEGQLAGPLVGQNGVFFIKATAIQDAAELDDAALANQRNQDVLREQNAFISKIQPAIVEIANVKDTRTKAGY